MEKSEKDHQKVDEDNEKGKEKASTQSAGPTGSIGPTPEDPLKAKVRILDASMKDLFNVSDAIIRQYLDNSDLIKSILSEMGLSSPEDKMLDDSTFCIQFDKFKKAFAISQDHMKRLAFLESFNKILSENTEVLLQSINDDGWIRKSNTKVMYGDYMGKVTTIILHLSKIYKISLAIKENSEKKIKLYPEVYKADEKLKFPDIVIYNCFKIFKLSNAASVSDRSKAINIVINNMEEKLKLTTKSPFGNFKGIIDGMDPLISVGSDMLNHHLKQRDQSSPTIAPNQLKGVLNKIMDGETLGKMMNSVRDSAAKSGGVPDIGSITAEVMKNLNPAGMMSSFQGVMASEMPELAKRMNETMPQGSQSSQSSQVPQGSNSSQRIQEEIIEESQMVSEEVIEN